jgi:hypothetical protein
MRSIQRLGRPLHGRVPDATLPLYTSESTHGAWPPADDGDGDLRLTTRDGCDHHFTLGVPLAALLGEEPTHVASIRRLRQVWGDLLRTFGRGG